MTLICPPDLGWCYPGISVCTRVCMDPSPVTRAYFYSSLSPCNFGGSNFLISMEGKLQIPLHNQTDPLQLCQDPLTPVPKDFCTDLFGMAAECPVTRDCSRASLKQSETKRQVVYIPLSITKIRRGSKQNLHGHRLLHKGFPAMWGEWLSREAELEINFCRKEIYLHSMSFYTV